MTRAAEDTLPDRSGVGSDAFVRVDRDAHRILSKASADRDVSIKDLVGALVRMAFDDEGRPKGPGRNRRGARSA